MGTLSPREVNNLPKVMKPESGGGRIYTWGNLALSILLCCLLGAQAGFRERKLSMGRKRQTDFSEILSALVPSFSPLHSLQSLPYRRKEKQVGVCLVGHMGVPRVFPSPTSPCGRCCQDPNHILRPDHSHALWQLPAACVSLFA